MARSLVLSLDGQEFPVSLVKVDREKLYGEIEIEAFDEKGNEASLKVLAADGKTLIDKGGTGLTVVDEDGTSISRSELSVVDEDGELIEPVPSSFSQTNVLRSASADDYLAQIVKSVYVLQPADGTDLDYLQTHLDGEQIYTFPFSYRGGLEYDSAYVIGAEKNAFMIIGKTAAFQYVRLNQAATLDAVQEEEISADEIEFDVLT
jgi:hypothetical protein